MFTIERERNKKETDLERKKKVHMKERSKSGRNAEAESIKKVRTNHFTIF